MKNSSLYKALILLAVGISVAGCHTIRPSTVATNFFISQIPQSSQKVGLVLEGDYKNFVSHDRGSFAEDPQTFLIGESLVPLTQAYVDHGFNLIETYSSLKDIDGLKGENYFIEPSIKNFDNKIDFSGQSINVTLAADIYDSNKKLIGSVTADGFKSGSRSLLSGGTSHITVSEALQEALLGLVKEINKKIG